MLIKQESITSHKLGSRDFWQIANSVLNKGKSDISPLHNSPEVLSFASNKAKYIWYQNVSDRIARAFNMSGANWAVALDISKAFDNVWHAGLLDKL